MKVSEDVLNALDAATTDGSQLILAGELDRKLYMATAKVIEAAGGKWNRKAKAHLFPGDAADAIESVILTGEITSAKQEFGAFYTPQALADRVVKVAGIKPGHYVYEPSAGQGVLVKAARKITPYVWADEILPENAKIVSALLYPEGGCYPTDFLAVKPVTNFDRVIMNPPFAKQADIRHVLHAFKFLKPGGRLVAIMSAGTRFRTNKLAQEFRGFVESNGGTIEDLPEGSFKESGTGVNTVLVTIDKQT